MTYKALKKRLDEIKFGDAEESHGDEDDILWDAIRTIASGHEDAQEMARLLVSWDEKNEDRTRWYA